MERNWSRVTLRMGIIGQECIAMSMIDHECLREWAHVPPLSVLKKDMTDSTRLTEVQIFQHFIQTEILLFT